MNRILVAVAACLGLLNLPADEPTETSSVTFVAASEPVAASKPATAPAKSAKPAETPWLKNVHAVYQGNEWRGTAVSVGPGTLYTAEHVISGQKWAYISVNSKWALVSVTPLPAADSTRDGAILSLAEGNLPSMEIREPEYREPVTVRGWRTNKNMRGMIVRDDMVSLDSGESGIDGGDSGGAVVGDDGKLLGIVKSYADKNEKIGAKKNHRVVYFVPAKIFKQTTVASATPAPAAPLSQPQNCPNGVCKKPQAIPQQQFFYRQR